VNGVAADTWALRWRLRLRRWKRAWWDIQSLAEWMERADAKRASRGEPRLWTEP
jgi:hypothetical protein